MVIALGVALAQSIEPQKRYERNETVKMNALGMSLRFDFVIFGDLNQYLLGQGNFRVGPQPGVSVAQVKASIEAAVQGQYRSLGLKGGISVEGNTLMARYQLSNNSFWRIAYRQGPQAQGVLLSSEAINPSNEARIGRAMQRALNENVTFFAPQVGGLEGVWKAILKPSTVFASDHMRGTDVVRFCDEGRFFFQGMQDFPRLNVIEALTPNDPKTRVAGRWRVYPISKLRALLILEYTPTSVRTLKVSFNDGSDGSTPALRLEGVPFFVRSPEQIAASKLDLPEC